MEPQMHTDEHGSEQEGPDGKGAEPGRLACVFPCQRFARDVAVPPAWLVAGVARRAFTVRLFYPLLHAG